jgi:putative PIN family toxin of toxin-antitoxin system
MQSVVVDTNIIISAALTGAGHPFQIMELLSDGVLRLCYSMDILAEYTDVLSRKKFNFSQEKQIAFINKIKEVGTPVSVPSSSSVPFADESDRIFYDLARFCKAILITGNAKHFPKEPFVVSPAELCKLFPSN